MSGRYLGHRRALAGFGIGHDVSNRSSPLVLTDSRGEETLALRYGN